MEGQNKHYRGNKYFMIEVDDVYQSGTILEFNDTEKNQILNRDMLAVYLVDRCNQEKNNEARELMFLDIVNLYISADKILMNQMNHLLGRAYVTLLEYFSTKDAGEEFALMLNAALECIPPKVGRSYVESEANCRRELTEHKKSLRLRVETLDDIRTDMGYCFMRLGDFKKAERSFQLALRTQSYCTLALVGLAVVRLINCQSPHTINLSEKLSKELTLDTMRIEGLRRVSHNYFKNKIYDKAIICSNIILQRSRNVDEIIKSLCLLGRIYEKKSEYNQAFTQFYKAVHLSPFVVGQAHYYLAKMYIMSCGFDKARSFFEMYLKHNPDCIKTKKVLSSLYLRLTDGNKHILAKKYYEEIVHKYENDLEGWVGVCMFSKNDNELLNRNFNIVLNLMSKTDKSKIKFEVLIGIALIHKELGNYAECCSILKGPKEILKKMTKTSIGCLYFRYLIRLINTRLATAYLDQQQFQNAKEIFKEMYEMEPRDLHVIINLANVANLRNQDNEACEYAKKALLIHPRCTLALEIIKMSNLEDKIDVYELNEPSITDTLKSLIELTDVAMLSVSHPSADKDNEFNSLALVLLEQLLHLNPETIWDVDGLGTILSKNCKFLRKFKYIFATTKKATELCTSWLFYADICVKQKRKITSIKILETCLNLFFIHDNEKVYRMLGHEYYIVGNYADCKKLLLKALMASPGNIFIINNLAFVLQRSGTKTLKNRKLTLKEVFKAFEDLKLAKKYFAFLLAQENIIIQGAANEGLLSCQLKICAMSSYKSLARRVNIELEASNSESQMMTNPNSTD